MLQPKSARDLKPGQFWGIRLDDGRYGCGRVLQVGGDRLPTPRVSFFGGLMNWVGERPPTDTEIANAPVLAFGVMHLRAITRVGTGVLGERALELDAIDVPTLLSAMGGDGCLVLRGAQAIRRADPSEWGRYPVLGFWGYDYIKQLAEHRFGCGAGGV